jgi:hypothetical protein
MGESVDQRERVDVEKREYKRERVSERGRD